MIISTDLGHMGRLFDDHVGIELRNVYWADLESGQYRYLIPGTVDLLYGSDPLKPREAIGWAKKLRWDPYEPYSPDEDMVEDYA